MVDYNNIPDELKKMKNWVCWAGDKLPKNPYTGGNAQSNNKQTWSDYNTAIEAIQKFNMSGIGFMFSPPFFGVDLDKCIDNVDFVDEFVDTLQSYTEYSKSGNGIHIICRGKLPDGARRRGAVEMYSEGRFFIMTGKPYREIRPIGECTETIKILHSKYLSEQRPAPAQMHYEKLDLSDNEIIDKARQAKNGVYFEALYRGSWQGGYTSQSEADLAFCNMLAFWTQRDYTQIDRIFRSSGLMRKKWDEMRGGVSYGQKTIEKAIAACGEVYNSSMQGIESTLVAGIKKDKEKIVIKDYDFSDTGNAKRFTDMFRGQIKYVFTAKSWFYWNGKYWCKDETGEIKKLADVCINSIKKQAFDIQDEEKQESLLKWALKTANSKPKQNMIIESQHLGGVATKASDFDIATDMLNCQNGIINLKNGEIIPHAPEFMLSRISYAEYDDKSGKKPERWLKFLDEITAGDKDLQRFLQKSIGYSLSGSTREQCMFFCFGNGNNGKSTFLDVVSDLAGMYGMNMQAESIMEKKNSGAVNTDIARLNGARFVTVAEPGEQMLLNESLVKQMTGGEKLTARFLFCDEFEFKPEFKIWIGTNHKPIIRGNDEGIWRRIRLIPFTVQIPKEKIDKGLSHKLRRELPLILKWAVDGCIMWQKEGLESPASVAQASTEYRQEMDVLSKFIEDCVEIDNKDRVKAGEIYTIYQKWASANNEYEMTNTKFGKEFLKRFPEKERLADGSYYKGCKLSFFAIVNYQENQEIPIFKQKRRFG